MGNGQSTTKKLSEKERKIIARLNSLTAKEKLVLISVAYSGAYEDSAEQLRYARVTVKSYLAKIKRKLAVKDMREAIVLAVHYEVIPDYATAMTIIRYHRLKR